MPSSQSRACCVGRTAAPEARSIRKAGIRMEALFFLLQEVDAASSACDFRPGTLKHDRACARV